MSYEVKLPQLSMGMSDAEVLEWLVEPGMRVSEGDDLVEVEAEKAAAIVPSPVSGTVTELKAEEGETVEVRAVLCIIAPDAS